MTRQETPNSVDLEQTAELPMLDMAGLPGELAQDAHTETDAWAPASATTAVRGAILAAVPAAEEHGRPDNLDRGLRDAEIGALRSDLASAAESRNQLEGSLAKLTTNLRDLEQMLNRKSEQLSVFEREVGQRDRRISALETQLTQITTQLTCLNTEHAAVVTRRDALSGELSQAREELGALTARLKQADSSATDWLAERGAHATRVQSLETAHARRVQVLEGDQVSARAHAERYHEMLQTLEARRGLFDTMLGDRESLISQRETRIAQLEREINQRSAVTGAREQDLLGQFQLESQRVRELESSISSVRAELQLQQNAAQAAAKQAQEHSSALTTEISTQAQTIGELRAQMAQMRESLEQRNALFNRLEAEAASSAAVLGNIQESLTHMGSAHAPSVGAGVAGTPHTATGTHAQQPAAELTRMLVRTEGETGIVQLLGKRTTIGRTPDNDIRIDADFISRHHAVILVNGASTVLEDLNSTNGTYVNGTRISRRPLAEGDLVTLGKSEFRFVTKQPLDRSA